MGDRMRRLAARVRWRKSWSEEPPLPGDLLVLPLEPGQTVPPGWTRTVGGEAAYRTVIGHDDERTTGVLIVSPPAPEAEATAVRPEEVAGPPPVHPLAAWAIEEPPVVYRDE